MHVDRRDLPRRRRRHKLVLELNSDYRTSVLKKLAGDPAPNLPVKPPHVSKVSFVIGPDIKRPAVEPVRNPAVSHLSMAEGADTQDDVELLLGAEINEVAEVLIAAPVKDALVFFMVIPKDIGRYDIDARHLHLDYLVFPRLIRVA